MQEEYAHLTDEELRQEYIKSEEFLMVFDRPMLKPEAQEKINQLEQQLKQQDEQLKQQDEMLKKIIAQQIKQLENEPTEEDIKEFYRQYPTSETIKLSSETIKKYKKNLKL